jgi:TRAP-type C4-dicarboxylate transport system permease small subunit
MSSVAANNTMATPQGVAIFLDAVSKLCLWLSALSLASMLLLVVNEVVMRYFFNSPTTWSMDVNQWLFALSVMMALPEVTRVNGNVAITILIDRMPEKKRVIATRIIFLVSFIACMVAFYIAGTETLRQFNSAITTTWVNPIPKWWISVCIPFSFLLSGLQFLRLALKRTTFIER